MLSPCLHPSSPHGVICGVGQPCQGARWPKERLTALHNLTSLAVLSPAHGAPQTHYNFASSLCFWDDLLGTTLVNRDEAKAKASESAAAWGGGGRAAAWGAEVPVGRLKEQ